MAAKRPPIDLSNIRDDPPNYIRSAAQAELESVWGQRLWRPETLKWTYDACSVAFLGFAFRPADLQPCTEDTYPCGAWAYKPGMLEPLTAHPIRANDYVTNTGEPNRPNQEVCEYAWGLGVVMGRDWRLRPVICTTPSERLGRPVTKLKRTCVSVGQFIVMPKDNKYGLPANRVYGACGLEEPPWQALFFSAPFPYCGAIA